MLNRDEEDRPKTGQMSDCRAPVSRLPHRRRGTAHEGCRHALDTRRALLPACGQRRPAHQASAASPPSQHGRWPTIRTARFRPPPRHAPPRPSRSVHGAGTIVPRGGDIRRLRDPGPPAAGYHPVGAPADVTSRSAGPAGGRRVPVTGKRREIGDTDARTLVPPRPGDPGHPSTRGTCSRPNRRR